MANHNNFEAALHHAHENPYSVETIKQAAVASVAVPGDSDGSVDGITELTCTNERCEMHGKVQGIVLHHTSSEGRQEYKGLHPCAVCGQLLQINEVKEVITKEALVSAVGGATVAPQSYDLTLEDFDIQEAIRTGVNQFIALHTDAVRDEMKAMVTKAAEALRPVVVKVGERKEVTMQGRLHKAFEPVLFLSQVERQAFLSGAAGTGKTTLAAQVAQGLQLPFAQISCSAGMSEAHLLGRMLFDGTYVPSDLVTLYENGGVFLFDEIDAADANTILVINSALANGILSVPNRKEKNHAVRHADFICICAANTWGAGSHEYHGRNHLDAAFLDRFAMAKVEVTYDVELEREICGQYTELYNTFIKIRKAVADNKLRRVVSTRAFISGTRQMAAGKKLSEVLQAFFTGWSPEEIKKANGVNA